MESDRDFNHLLFNPLNCSHVSPIQKSISKTEDRHPYHFNHFIRERALLVPEGKIKRTPSQIERRSFSSEKRQQRYTG